MGNVYMKRAIDLAKLGEGRTNPNPIVGAVIVKDGRVIGEGWHERYGGAHAERNALANCTEDPRGAYMYVTLSPCCHHGKQPPCTDAIIDAGIKRIYIGSFDPNPLVAKENVTPLREAGIEVVEGVMGEECDALNTEYFYYITHKLPYVILKSAVSMDGRIAARTGDSKWITGEEARYHAHTVRKRCAAIMVGINTVIADDPMLNCRVAQSVDPLRIVCDSSLRIPEDSVIMRTADRIPTLIAASERADRTREARLRELGADVVYTGGERVDIPELMKILAERGVDSVIVEGGAQLSASVIKTGLVREVDLYIAPKIIGGDGLGSIGDLGLDKAADAPGFPEPEVIKLGKDVLLRYGREA